MVSILSLRSLCRIGILELCRLLQISSTNFILREPYSELCVGGLTCVGVDLLISLFSSSETWEYKLLLFVLIHIERWFIVVRWLTFLILCSNLLSLPYYTPTKLRHPAPPCRLGQMLCRKAEGTYGTFAFGEQRVALQSDHSWPFLPRPTSISWAELSSFTSSMLARCYICALRIPR